MMTKEATAQILDSIESEHMDRLTPWEKNFFESVKDQFDRRGFLTEGQDEKLEQIWVKLP